MSDLISRQDAIDRINKQREHLQPDMYAQDAIGDAAYRICAEFIERLPSAERKGDLISKEDVLDEIHRCLEERDYTLGSLYDNVCEMPSAERVGKWIHPYKSEVACECSVCHMQMPITDWFHFCPNCGARMEGEKE